jgi:zinc transport system substrate-binding protein
MSFRSRFLRDGPPALAVLLLVAAPPGPLAAAEPALRIVVSILPLKQVAARIGGERVAVSVLVGPGQSPETFEPTPRQIAELAGARLFVRAGVPFERIWFDRISAAHPRLRTVDWRDAMGGMAGSQAGQHTDPHLWSDPRLMMELADRIAGQLARLDPAGAEDYGENLARLQADLRALDREIETLITGSGVRRFLIYHPAWGQFARRYGLEQIAIEEDGKEPSARRLAELIDWARRAGVEVIFVQPQASQVPARALAREIGARLVALDPLAEDYLGNMRAAARAIAEGSIRH